MAHLIASGKRHKWGRVPDARAAQKEPDKSELRQQTESRISLFSATTCHSAAIRLSVVVLFAMNDCALGISLVHFLFRCTTRCYSAMVWEGIVFPRHYSTTVTFSKEHRYVLYGALS